MSKKVVLSIDSKVFNDPKLINLDAEVFKFE
mgnify:CR=1 FL=1